MSERIWACFLAVLLLIAMPGAADPTRVVQADEILNKIELGLPVEYDNVIVEGNLDLSGLDLPRTPVKRTWFETYSKIPDYEVIVTSPISITNSLIEESVIFKGVNFQKATKFYWTKFNGPVFLSGSRFNDTAVFDRAWFNDTTVLSYTRFNNRASFNNARFNDAAYVGMSWFNDSASFSNACFNNTASFQYVQFNDIAQFDSARFNDTVYFDSAQFKDYVSFWKAQFSYAAWFENSRFNDTAYFNSAHFRGGISFLNASFSDAAYFGDVQSNYSTYFMGARFNRESEFRDAHLANLFLDDAQFEEEVIFDGVHINGTLSLYRTKYNTLNIRWSSIHDLAYDDTAYHLLIQNFNKLGFGDDAKECQYSYRCKHREELFRQHKFDSWIFDLLAYATYGYGLRPVRPLGWAALFIFIGGLFFFLTGSVTRSKERPSGKKPPALRRKEEKPDGSVSIYEALLLSATYFTSGASSIISATPSEFVPLGRGRYVVVILRLLGWIFFVLFLSSLTRTV